MGHPPGPKTGQADEFFFGSVKVNRLGRPASQGRNEVVGGGRGSIGNLQMKAGNVDALLKTTRRRGKQREAWPVINVGASSMETIPAMMWDSLRGWVQRHEGHGIVEVTVTTNKEDYDRFKIRFPKISPKRVKGVADSGCQAPLMGTDMLYRLGLRKKDLVQVACRVSLINGGSITVLGVILLRIIGEDKTTGKTVEAAAQVPVAEGVKDPTSANRS